MNALIGHAVMDQSAAVALRNAALSFCKQAMKRRNAIVVNYLTKRLDCPREMGVELRPSGQ